MRRLGLRPSTPAQLTARPFCGQADSLCWSPGEDCPCRPAKTERKDEDQDKLLELTAQCINYYNRYSYEKDTHSSLVRKAFHVLRDKVEESFGRLIQQAQQQQASIESYLEQEERKLLEDKNQQEERLSHYLKDIKEVHLTRLLKN
jgi:hypothetical protein